MELDALDVLHVLVLHGHDGLILRPAQNLQLVLWKGLLLDNKAVVPGRVKRAA